ncbi:Hypothetical protein NTJ_07685 [Nesidiocoris tenuis]|uniref:Uncharacterized protein n=1 Tax=Nesidiocoris tenuis TaxID=355587 RepID=A0ABN7AVB3_9HEMI|nr:Hypothetical protein NTJ_07685 [Nesidiocoris tenuis]
MLVVCSGGQWWYRYWVNGGRYLIPPPHVSVSSSTTRQMHHRSPLATETSTRVLYHPSPHGHGSTVVFWKPPYPRRPMAEPPPSYATVIPPSPKLTYGQQIPSGPPPSYDSVVGLSNAAASDRADPLNSSSAERAQQHIDSGEPSSAPSQFSRSNDIPAISAAIPPSSGSPTIPDPHRIT